MCIINIFSLLYIVLIMMLICLYVFYNSFLFPLNVGRFFLYDLLFCICVLFKCSSST